MNARQRSTYIATALAIGIICALANPATAEAMDTGQQMLVQASQANIEIPAQAYLDTGPATINNSDNTSEAAKQATNIEQTTANGTETASALEINARADGNTAKATLASQEVTSGGARTAASLTVALDSYIANLRPAPTLRA